MSNSFNISVLPEIEAIKAVVDLIKADTGPIRNDVTAIHDTNLPAVKVDTGAIRNDVTAIHDTNLPAVKTDTGAIRNDVTDIHDVDLPSVKTDSGAIRNDVTDIKDSDLPAAVVKIDDVKSAIDALPTPDITVVSGAVLLHTNAAEVSIQSTTYVEVKSTLVYCKGTISVLFDLKSGTNTAYGKIYVNDVPVGTERTRAGTYVTFTEDITVEPGDSLEIYVKNSAGGAWTFVENFLIKGIPPNAFTTVA